MRKLLSSTAGATFHEEHPKMTMCVRKDLVEIIVKLERGIYMVLNMIRMSDPIPLSDS